MCFSALNWGCGSVVETRVCRTKWDVPLVSGSRSWPPQSCGWWSVPAEGSWGRAEAAGTASVGPRAPRTGSLLAPQLWRQKDGQREQEHYSNVTPDGFFFFLNYDLWLTGHSEARWEIEETKWQNMSQLSKQQTHAIWRLIQLVTKPPQTSMFLTSHKIHLLRFDKTSALWGESDWKK